jgi:hypothetical protein
MRLVWSQPSVPHGRPRSLLPLAVLFLFLGGVVSAHVLHKIRRPGARLSLAPPAQPDSRPLSSFSEEEQR